MDSASGIVVLISDDDDSSEDDQQQQQQLNGSGANGIKSNEMAKNLLKWTNYINGWQERYFVLKNGVLSYYKNECDTQFGCRGSLTLKQSQIQTHELDDCRFDIRVNDSVWYLRAQSMDEREEWMHALDEQRKSFGLSETNLKKHPSLLSLTSVSCASSTSYNKVMSHNLKEKLAEIETYKDILCKQIETLQVYFDACANSVTKGFEPYNKEEPETEDVEDLDLVQQSTAPTQQQLDKTRIQDHAAMSIDFKGEAYTFKATAMGILTHLSHCTDMMYQSEDSWRKKFDRQVDKRKKLEEKYKQIIKQKNDEIAALTRECASRVPVGGTPDFEEGPHSTLKEEQFFDAIDNTLDNLELEEERRLETKIHLQNVQLMKSDAGAGLVDGQDAKPPHPLNDTIKKIVDEHLKFDRQELTDIWELFASDGEMKLYRREVEENGIVLDPLKAVHTVKGVTGYEVCNYFWDPKYRMDWETTLDTTHVLEVIDQQTLLFHQIHKRVWPAAQRDLCFWSHMRSVSHNDDEQPYWVVCNYSAEHEKAPVKEPMIRAIMNVAMTCETIIVNPPTDKSNITRDNLLCKIIYVAQVNPGGWLPAGALRTVYKREYPKFLKRFTQYVIDQTSKKPITF